MPEGPDAAHHDGRPPPSDRFGQRWQGIAAPAKLFSQRPAKQGDLDENQNRRQGVALQRRRWEDTANPRVDAKRRKDEQRRHEESQRIPRPTDSQAQATPEPTSEPRLALKDQHGDHGRQRWPKGRS